MTPPPTDAPECTAFRLAVAEAFDEPRPSGSGARPLPDGRGSSDPAHDETCADCRRYAAAARVLADLPQVPRPVPSAGFTNRVVIAALRERRVRAYRRAGAGVAVAAGLVAAVVLTRPRTETNEPRPGPEFVRASPVRVEEHLAGAGAALVAMTRGTADDAIGPARALIPSWDAPAYPSVVPPGAGPAVEALAEMPQAAQAGFEPVTNSARRAVALFLRDTGLSDPVTH